MRQLNGLSPPKLYVALLHHPVKNKNGETIASAVTNLDLHDISRAAKTYGIGAFYVVTPLEDQRSLVEEIVSHWINGRGGTYNPKRKEALSLIKIRDSLPEVIDEIKEKDGLAVKVVATCAADFTPSIRFNEFRHLLGKKDVLYLLVFGTAWGLTDTFLQNVDLVLEPIRGSAGYNHLSVRSAVSIILDRLLGDRL